MTINTTDDTTEIKYYLVTEVDGVEVRRTEIKQRERDSAGRFRECSAKNTIITETMAICPKCGHAFRVSKVLK